MTNRLSTDELSIELVVRFLFEAFKKELKINKKFFFIKDFKIDTFR